LTVTPSQAVRRRLRIVHATVRASRSPPKIVTGSRDPYALRLARTSESAKADCQARAGMGQFTAKHSGLKTAFRTGQAMCA
jgi:hypothetical protein